MKKNIIFTIFAIIIALLGTACSSSSNKASPGISLGNNTIAGQVINSQGLPVPNAEVQLYASKNAHKTALAKETLAGTSLAMRMSMVEQEFRTTTNQNGEYSFTNVPDGEYTLLAMAGNALQFVQTGIIANSTRGDTTAINPVLVPTGIATGKVTLTGEPFAGAVLYLDGTDNIAITDPMGNFAFSGVAAGNYSLKLLETPLPDDINKVIALAGAISLTIEAASTVDLPTINLTTKSIEPFKYYAIGSLSPNAPIENLAGIVVLGVEAKGPIAYSTRGAYMGNTNALELALGLTDANGKFTIPFREAGNYTIAPLNPYVEFAVEPRIRMVEVKTTNLESSPLVIAGFSLIKGFELYGTLANNAEPISQTTIIFHSETTGRFSTMTDSVGSYSIYLPNGVYTLTCEGHEIVAPTSVTISNEEQSLDIEAVVPLAVVSGVVEDGDYPMHDVPLVFKNVKSGVNYSVSTNVNGAYELELPYGSYKLMLVLNEATHSFEELELEINTSAQTRDIYVSKIVTTIAPKTSNINADDGISQTVKGFEVIGDYVYVITQTGDKEIAIKSYEDSLLAKKDEYTINTESSILNISTAVYNNNLYVLTVDNGAQNMVWVFNANLVLINQVNIAGEPGVNELVTDGNTLMYLLNDQNLSDNVDGSNSYPGALLKEFGTHPEKDNIRLSTTIKHIVPALDDQYVYYPNFQLIDGANHLSINKKPRDNGNDLRMVTLPLADGIQNGIIYEESDFISCELSIQDEYLYLMAQIKTADSDTSFFTARIRKSDGYFDTSDAYLNNAGQLTKQSFLPRPDQAIPFHQIAPIDYVRTPSYILGTRILDMGGTSQDVEFYRFINPYRVSGEKTFVLCKDDDNGLLLYVVYDNNWAPIRIVD